MIFLQIIIILTAAIVGPLLSNNNNNNAVVVVFGWTPPQLPTARTRPFSSSSSSPVSSSSTTRRRLAATTTPTTPEAESSSNNNDNKKKKKKKKKGKKRVVIVGAGWGGLSAAHALLSSSNNTNTNDYEVTLIDASSRVGGLVRDGYSSSSSRKQKQQQSNRRRAAEAGQHGFWYNYYNIFQLLQNNEDCFGNDLDQILTQYAPQGQYSPRGLEAVWPVYNQASPQLPTGLAQLIHTQFFNLPLLDKVSALPLVLAFSECLDNNTDLISKGAVYEKYDTMSFYDLCQQLGVTKRCYEEAFEPMILTGLFAPGRECSAAAALGMAYFFVLQSQNAFDVRWCKGNIGSIIFTPWIKDMISKGLILQSSTKVTDFYIDDRTDRITKVYCEKKDENDGERQEIILDADDVIVAVGATALQNFVRYCPSLASYQEFRKFANLRGTSVLATRLYLDKDVTSADTFTANACWGFHKSVGMTFFDIRALHGESSSTTTDQEEEEDYPDGSIIEVDYYYANSLLALSDEDLIEQVKSDLDQIFGIKCRQAIVIDTAIVRLPNAVNWYFPGSYQLLPDLQAASIDNLYFAGDIVKTPHQSWSQEKAYVTGKQAANLLMGKLRDDGIIPAGDDELHVGLGKDLVRFAKTLVPGIDISNSPAASAPSLLDFFGIKR